MSAQEYWNDDKRPQREYQQSHAGNEQSSTSYNHNQYDEPQRNPADPYGYLSDTQPTQSHSQTGEHGPTMHQQPFHQSYSSNNYNQSYEPPSHQQAPSLNQSYSGYNASNSYEQSQYQSYSQSGYGQPPLASQPQSYNQQYYSGAADARHSPQPPPYVSHVSPSTQEPTHQKQQDIYPAQQSTYPASSTAPEAEKGLLGAIAGGAVGGYAGHQVNHGFIGAVGGAYAGHKLEDAIKDKKKEEKRARKEREKEEKRLRQGLRKDDKRDRKEGKRDRKEERKEAKHRRKSERRGSSSSSSSSDSSSSDSSSDDGKKKSKNKGKYAVAGLGVGAGAAAAGAYTHHQSQSQFQPHSQSHPQILLGNFSASSTSITLDPPFDLIASCSTVSGTQKLSSIDLNDYLTNEWGTLKWQRGGGFGGSSRNARLVDGGKVLEAELGDGRGGWRPSFIRLDERIGNSNGVLVYVD